MRATQKGDNDGEEIEHSLSESAIIQLPPVLRYLSHSDIRILETVNITWSDYLKTLAESYSGSPWNWWPLSPRTVPLMPGNIRLQLKEKRFVDLPAESGMRYLANLQNNSASGASASTMSKTSGSAANPTSVAGAVSDQSK